MSERRKALSRREFLRVGGAGLAGVTLMTASACASGGGITPSKATAGVVAAEIAGP